MVEIIKIFIILHIGEHHVHYYLIAMWWQDASDKTERNTHLPIPAVGSGQVNW